MHANTWNRKKKNVCEISCVLSLFSYFDITLRDFKSETFYHVLAGQLFEDSCDTTLTHEKLPCSYFLCSGDVFRPVPCHNCNHEIFFLISCFLVALGLMLTHVCSLFNLLDQSVVDNRPNRSRAPEVLDRYTAEIPGSYEGEKGTLARFVLSMLFYSHHQPHPSCGVYVCS